MRILAGDIGGTNSRLALYDRGPAGQLVPVAEEVFPSANYRGLDEVVVAFLTKHHTTVVAACFGMAGPVQNGRWTGMNIDWVVDERELAQQLAIPRVSVINDLSATAYGVPHLTAQQVATIQEGEPQAGNGAIISAGTGLGQAGLFWDGKRFHPIVSEGGHVDFAPRNPLEFELLQYLQQRYDHVSYERIVSGMGQVNLYEFLRDTGRGEEPAWLTDELKNGDPAAVISKAGLSGRSPLCQQAVDLLLDIYGAEAGNLTLKVLAIGGVWLGGGIVVKVLDRLRSTGLFLNSFLAKGRLRRVLERIPVRAILNDKIGLLGAAHHALDLVE